MSKEVGTPRYLNLVVLLKKVGDEVVHKELGDRMERAATTTSSLKVEQDNDTILGDVDAQTRFKTTSKQSNDPPLSRGYTLGSGEDSIKLLELMELCTKLRKQRKDTTVTQEEIQQDDGVPTPSNDPPLSEKAKDAQTKEIADLKKRVQKLERKKKSRTTGFKRLRKVGESRRVESSEDKDIDDTQGRSDNEEMFDTNDLHGDMPVGEKQEQSAKEREVDTSVEDSAAPTTIEEITLAQTLIQIKATKPKVVTTAATTTTATRPKAKGVVVQEPSEFRTPQESQPSMIKDKGKAIMIEPEVPLKRKDQVALNEDLARNLQAQLEAKLIEEERLTTKKEEEANIALIESWDNTQAMMEADFELAQRLQTEEQGEITIEERSRLFVELMNKRKKHFAMLRAEEKRRKPPTKA
ncbi:hypothetical protein Tco_1308488 [Tanacetum coccineum]